jgi:hypothetical protein
VRPRPVLLSFGLAAAALCSAARAEGPQPAGIPDLLGARALSLSAYRAVTPGNDAIYTNAAALAARRRYSLETQWLTDRLGADTDLQVLTGSVVDSESSVTGGFAYTRVLSGPWQGNLFHLPFAFAATDTLFLGATAKYGSLDGPAGERMRAANVDASAWLRASTLFSLGVAGYNLVSAGHRQVQPRGLGLGAALGDDRRFHLGADWRGDFDRRGKLTNLYAVGGEILALDLFPIRAGWMRDETREASFWSVGVGVVTAGGVALDLAYRQGIEDTSQRTLGAALKIFLISQ